MLYCRRKLIRRMATDYFGQLPKLIAHRGAKAYAPENTLAALRKAAELGAKWVEFDVMLDSRHHPIIFHDLRLNRTTNGRGFVSRTPYSVIVQLDAGSWFNAEFAGEYVPTLEEWLQEAAKLNLGVNVELKGTKAQASFLAESVVANLNRYWKSGLIAPIISSTSVDCLAAVRKRAPHFLLGYIANRWPSYWEKILTHYDCVSLHINHLALNEERVRQVKAENYLLLAYTVNDRHRANELFDMGVDSVFSDDPLLLDR